MWEQVFLCQQAKQLPLDLSTSLPSGLIKSRVQIVMEVAVEIEDDLFFQDLSKQISLLIMDDDEDPVSRCPSVSLQVLLHIRTCLSSSYLTRKHDN